MTTGKVDDLGVSHLNGPIPLRVSGESSGSSKDMGSLVLFLVANWFVNGEYISQLFRDYILIPTTYQAKLY